MKFGIGLVLISGVAAAAPKSINIQVQRGQLHEVARKLGEQSGCRIMAFGDRQTVDLDVRNGTLWDALAKLEIDHGIKSVFRGSVIYLEPKGQASLSSFSGLDPNPTWTKHWRGGSGGWSFALLGDSAANRARLIVLGLDGGSIDKVVIDKATTGGKQLKAVPGVPVALTACQPSAVAIDLDAPATKLSLRGHVVFKVPKLIEKRVVVPFDDSVVDIAEGRLRIHVASMPATGTSRTVMVNWDGLGKAIKVDVELVDDTGAPVKPNGRGSGSSSSGQAHEDFTISTTSNVTAILRIPGTATADEKVPFRFDNEVLEKPTRP